MIHLMVPNLLDHNRSSGIRFRGMLLEGLQREGCGGGNQKCQVLLQVLKAM